MAGTDRSDRAPLSQSEQERRPASVPSGHVAAGFCAAVAADPPTAAVVFTQRPGVYAAKRSGPEAVGRGPDRGAHHAPLCWH